MSHSRSTVFKKTAASVLVLASFGAHAAVTTYFAAQEPKADLSNPAPPVRNASVLAKMAEFNSMITPLGGNEFEGRLPSLDFAYTGGNATAVGNPTAPSLVDGAVASFGLGRYNMTPGLLDPFGDPLWGHWLEASSNFSYQFSSAVGAFAFLGTDFFDFAGTLAFSIFNGNALVGQGTVQTQNTDSLNGNLIFFGLTSTTAFDRIGFSIAQASPTNTDVLGFDSIVVGQAVVDPGTVPEPGTLALAGLALMGLAASRRRRS